MLMEPMDPFTEPDPPPASPLEAFRVPPCPVTVGLPPAAGTKLIQLYGGPWDGAVVTRPASLVHLDTDGHTYHFHAETSARRGRETWVSCYVRSPQF